MRILLVEDEKDMAAALAAALSRHDVVVDFAPNLEIAAEACRSGVYDAVLLDRKLPDGDGLSLIPLLRREQPGLPVIVLSALGSADHRIAGLDHGADDYLAKPFSTDELMARLRAVMRRPAQIGPSAVNIGRLQFNLTERQADVEGVPLSLTRRNCWRWKYWCGAPDAPCRAALLRKPYTALTTTSRPMRWIRISRACEAS